MESARRKTGLSDLGDSSFLTPLRRLLASLRETAPLPFVPRFWLHAMIQQNLVNRLQIQSDFARCPAISQVPVRRPIFIVGMPRTGTTFLHRLLAQDPANRAFRSWELREPSPPPRPETFEQDPRRRKLRRAESFAKLLFTRRQREAGQSIHAVAPDDPDECELLFRNSFTSITLAGFVAAISGSRSYLEWLLSQNREWVYREHRRQVQLLSWHAPGERLLLKCPEHAWAIDALLNVYPDASLVWTHRDPVKQVLSTCSILDLWIRLFFDEDLDSRGIGVVVAKDLKAAIERALEARRSADPARFHDLLYADLVKDPIGSVRRLYSVFDYELTAEAESGMRSWLASDRDRRKGARHLYQAEDFGLEVGAVRDGFGFYQERFGIPVEQT